MENVNEYYKFSGFNKDFDFVRNIEKCYNISQALKNLNRIYNKEDINKLNKLFESFGHEIIMNMRWENSNQIERKENSDNLTFNINKVFLIDDIKINSEMLNYLYFNSNAEKEDFVQKTEMIIKNYIGTRFVPNNLFNKIKIWEDYERNYKNPPFFLLIILDFYMSEYIYVYEKSSNYVNVFNCLKRVESYKFNERIREDKEMLKWNTLNLKAKIKSNYSNISFEEQNIMCLINSDKLYDVNEYDLSNAIEYLVINYIEKNHEKALAYLKILKEKSNLISNVSLSHTYKNIGKEYHRIGKKEEAYSILSNALELNKDIGVKRIVDKLKKDLN